LTEQKNRCSFIRDKINISQGLRKPHDTGEHQRCDENSKK